MKKTTKTQTTTTKRNQNEKFFLLELVYIFTELALRPPSRSSILVAMLVCGSVVLSVKEVFCQPCLQLLNYRNKYTHRNKLSESMKAAAKSGGAPPSTLPP